MTAARRSRMGTHAFQAEVGRVLSLVINSLYSNKEIFLRELVSNASDALDKLRFRALTEPALLEGEPELVIRLRVEPDAKALVIEDTGIGMTEAELVENLGTVAKSGSAAFIEKLEAGAKKDVSLIGQFGVGFYSAYLVADRVEVVSRAAGSGAAWRWTSSGRDTFEVEPAERAARGTEIRLFLKDEHAELLEPWRLRDLVRRYSDYVAYPIELEAREKKDDGDKGDGEAAAPKRETINRGRALWQRPKNEITDEQYEELYKHLTHDWEPPVARTHFRVEGTQEFVGLFWIPKNPPFDLDDPRKQRGVRLFVKRVLVMEDCEAILPQWLRFVRGLVDSDDLPLNVSRELLQESAALRTIKKQVTKRALDLLDELAADKPEDYKAVWSAFGRILKEGLAVDPEWKERIAKLSRWPSTYAPAEGASDALVSLDEYVGRMKEGQEAIYYVTGESREALSGSPHLEALRARGFEVLLMTDAVDTWAAEGIGEHGGKKLVNAMRAEVKLPEDEEDKTKEAAKELEPLVAAAKKVLDGKVRDVAVSSRLRESPACLVLAGAAMPAHLEKLLARSGKEVPKGQRNLELNPTHPAVKALATLAAKDAADPKLADWVTLLYEQSLISEGSPVEDPNGFAKRMTALLVQAVS
ncbi:MAG: molecular chaperone HtpG [Labilithrix sp.]|nr:molecular chaperone HtpG [Labilithrix sp.]MCW5833193.1 molecular chaperone HtpG [Labilithrix sp.]